MAAAIGMVSILCLKETWLWYRWGTTEIAVIALGGIVCDKSVSRRFHEWYRILHAYPTQSICGRVQLKIKSRLGGNWRFRNSSEDMSVQGRFTYR
jgi:actin-like ATPase involved in cell morphogenesis